MTSIKCELCEFKTKAVPNVGEAKRLLGVHRRSAHGIKGMTARERYYVYKKNMTLEQAQAAIAAKDGGSPPPVRQTKPKTDVIPMALNYCPFCNSRFYGAKGANEHQD